MKYKIYSLITALAASLALTSCEDDFLDRQLGTELSEERIFTSYDLTRDFLNGAYATLPQGFNRIDGAMLATATDDAEHTWEGSAVQRFNNGSWTPYSNPDDLWNTFYSGIRKTNQFLEKSGQVDLESYRINPQQQEEYQNRLQDLKRWRYEARYLRAYFYFELVKRYGGVPLITSTLTLADDLTNIPRQPLTACIQFIATECDSAASGLSITPGRGSNDANASGRATKGAALALKSRVLLYAASDLYHHPVLPGSNPALIALTNQDQAVAWREAATAAKAVIDLNAYQLGSDYSGLFNTYNNPEIIMTHRYGASNDFERANYPIGYEGGQSGTTPTQNLVDAYETKDGKLITDPSSGYDAQNPYANRDPRLLQTVLVNNAAWNGRPVEAWVGGRDGKGKERATKTGYYLKKYVAENLDLLQNRTATHTWILFRLAEIYLNYAEALNEYDPGNADIAKYVNLVRTRAGMTDLPGGLSQAEMRNRIRNERRVELAFEEHRFWDVRRWKEGSQFSLPARGLNITRNPDNTFRYEPIIVENRVFETKMYWYPIPENERIKTGWVQNPGW